MTRYRQNSNGKNKSEEEAMGVQHVMWNAFQGCGVEQLANGRKILDVCAGSVPETFAGLIHRSGMVIVPADSRLTSRSGTYTPPYPQDWHTNWKTWTRSMALIPTGFAPTRFAIVAYIPLLKELKICPRMRTAGNGAFALRLINQEQHVFLIAERQITLRPGRIFGGMEESAIPLPEDADLY